MSQTNQPIEDGLVLVCGLGRLGQHCARVLKELGAVIHAVEAHERRHWALPDLPKLFDKMVIGDCRLPGVLEQAEVARCRAILLVTGDERTNIAAAFAARRLNPEIRVVLRSAQETLNALLCQTLGNIVAFEPTQLSVNAFALAALGDETVGLVTVEDRLIPIQRHTIGPGHRWQGRRLYEIDAHGGRVLNHVPRGEAAARGFHGWNPETAVQVGDSVAVIDLAGQGPAVRQTQAEDERGFWRTLLSGASWSQLRHAATRFWREGSQIRRANIVSFCLILAFYLLGVLLYRQHYPQIGLREALNVPLVLILGGYDNLFGQLTLPFPIPAWLHLFSFALTVAGTLFLGIVYATLTEQVLSARFRFRQQRPPTPKAGHVVLVGLGRVGRQVAALLGRLKQPLIGLNDTELPGEALPDLPVVAGNPRDGLAQVNLMRARSLMAVADDEIANLEIALQARAINPGCRLVIRMDDPAFSGNVSELVPGARALGTYALAAEAFAAAAFGEAVHGLFHLDGQTVLVVEYTVASGDTLDGRLLAEVAYGYGLVPILFQRPDRDQSERLPSDDIHLQAGDRLTVLATRDGLGRAEQDRPLPRSWRVQVERALTPDSAFEAAMAIARVAGCEIAEARALMSRLPDTLGTSLYHHQALRLVRELYKVGCRAALAPATDRDPDHLRSPSPSRAEIAGVAE